MHPSHKLTLAYTLLLLLTAPSHLAAQQQTLPAEQTAAPAYLYKASLVQAAPGKILDLVDTYKKIFTEQTKIAGDPAPLWMRHSQGDRWDLLILFPMASYTDYYKPDRNIKRATVLDPWHPRLKDDIAWQEDVFVYGPPLEDLRKAFANAGLFHVEMFQSLPGKQAELQKQREIENAFSRAIKSPENFIFIRDQGAAWDLFTIGCYENLKHYAQAADVPPAEADAAAKSAGFESSAQIGPYLRTLISLHHDTLAVANKAVAIASSGTGTPACALTTTILQQAITATEPRAPSLGRSLLANHPDPATSIRMSDL